MQIIHQQGVNLPILLPISPIMESEAQKIPVGGTSALEIAVLESPTTLVPKDLHEEGIGELPSKSSSGLFGWMKEALPGKSILAKVAEKARNSVDSMITTLDPQMKEFICKTLFTDYQFEI